MKSRKVREKRERSLAYRIFYIFAIAAIAAIWIYAFRSYFRHYDSMHPEITWALPWVQIDMIMSDGVFLWNETLVTTPRAGSVSYPLGTAPIRVQRGAVVARVKSGNAAYDIRASSEGYFVAGLDGMEEKWRYASLWQGTSELPKAGPLKPFKDGHSAKSGAPIGKIIPQPQDLRFIGYANLTGELEKKLAANRVMVKMDELDTPSRAQVRVYETLGHRVKMYLSMPWFPPGMLTSRNYRLIVEAGESSGVVVPESAVTMRSGKTGAFVIKGSEAVFTDVEGRVIDGDRFLVAKGIKLGDAVIVNAESAREGRVKLW